ncbi:MAG: KEOPS complex subunit Pcc1 [Candidatus Methanomethylophilus sp.]|nr:KEOPS complex subunit Pcc1 [Methanomethylophilus sp.]MDD3233316.1 KEOPS complex subunit Pcc1 [Methanomethylophilus sp.]MDD4221572.1 KEOPS complex subunit Pcc1 [Methanomethylophilus sp.]MDD4668725.1 KEOPS complex subunit Pcc1 [Methanomethylophilus sp.]
MPTATLRIESADAANIVATVGPEARRDLPRTHVEICLDRDVAVLSVEAADTTAMRAALNSYLECIMITENIDSIAKEST